MKFIPVELDKLKSLQSKLSGMKLKTFMHERNKVLGFLFVCSLKRVAEYSLQNLSIRLCNLYHIQAGKLTPPHNTLMTSPYRFRIISMLLSPTLMLSEFLVLQHTDKI